MPPDPLTRGNPDEHGVPLTPEVRTVTAPASLSGSTTVDPAAPPAPAGAGQVSRTIGDFIVLKLLGEGSAGKVFLARQVSLDRHVALKVAANLGVEARTMASLEHESIVRVFSETVDPETDQRLLCMQYVAGTTLERVIAELRAEDPRAWSGRRILEVIDGLSSQPTILDPAALRGREELAQCDFFEAACWLGRRLAEALDYAHLQGVLHRDIKPANILLNQYGRPMLADFSVASHSSRRRGAGRGLLGGTFPYMAPEHLDAFNPKIEVGPGSVDQRSDIYSLGVVLFEVVTETGPSRCRRPALSRFWPWKRWRSSAVRAPRRCGRRDPMRRGLWNGRCGAAWSHDRRRAFRAARSWPRSSKAAAGSAGWRKSCRSRDRSCAPRSGVRSAGSSSWRSCPTWWGAR